MVNKTACGRVSSISLGVPVDGEIARRACELELTTETDRIRLYFDDANTLVSTADRDLQRYEAMVELITQCNLADLQITVGFASAEGRPGRNLLHLVQVDVRHCAPAQSEGSRVENVSLKWNGPSSGSFQFSVNPPAPGGSATLILNAPLTQLSGAIVAAMAHGTALTVIEEGPNDTTPWAIAISVRAS